MSAPSPFGRPLSSRLRWLTAACLAAGAVAANIAFIGLGSSFEYPDILQRPASEILELFNRTRNTTMGWFALLAAGALLLGPAAVLLARQGRGRVARWSAWAGVAAAVVQVVGLSRWFVLVPGFADRATGLTATVAERADALSSFDRAHQILGTVVGETFGYAFTACWTLLVIAAFAHLPAWFRWLGVSSALLIFSGVLVPLDVPGADLANFAGYVLWSLWLLALATLVAQDRIHAGPRRPAAEVSAAEQAASSVSVAPRSHAAE